MMRLTLVLMALAVAAGAAETGTISGKVYDVDSGEPVQGVRVELLRVSLNRVAPLSEPVFAVTDKRGRFRLKKVPAGEWLVGVRDARMAPGSDDLAVSLEPGEKVKKLKLTASEGGSIEGGVYEDLDFSQGVAGLVVECYEWSGDKPWRVFRGVTDNAGQYRIGGLPPGSPGIDLAPNQPYLKFSPVFMADEIAWPAMIVKKGKPPIKMVEFQVKKAYSVSGVVVDTTGKPVAGAEVGFPKSGDYEASSFEPVAETDEEGRFRILSLESRIEVLSARKGALVSPHRRCTSGEPCTIRLVKPSRIRGRVVDQAGQPLNRVEVRFERRVSTAFGETDDDGRFDTGDVFAGTYSVKVWDASSPSRRFDIFDAGTVVLEEEQTIDDYTIVVKFVYVTPEEKKAKGLRVSGRVTGPDGEPVAGARVTTYLRSNAAMDQAQSDSDGAYTLRTPLTGEEKEPNRLVVMAKAEGFNYGFLQDVAPGSTGNDLALERAPLVVLRMVDDLTGEPVGAYRIEARDMWGPREADLYLKELAVRKVESETGEVELRLPASVWRVDVDSKGYVPEQENITTNDGGDKYDFEFRLRREVRLEGIVRKPDGIPLEGAKLGIPQRLRPGLDENPSAESDAAGRFVFEGLVPGSPIMSVSHPAYSDKAVDVKLRQGETSFVDVTLEEYGRLWGRVTLGGRPVESVVWAYSGGGGFGQAKTDEEGRYLLDEVNAGGVTVAVDVGDRGVCRRAHVRAGHTATADFDIPRVTSGLKGTLRVEGQPVGGLVWIHFLYPSGESEKCILATLQDGGYSMVNLPAGRAIVQFRVRGKGAVCHEVEFPENGVLELDGEIGGLVSVSGVVKGVHNWMESMVRILAGHVGRVDLERDPVSSLDARCIDSYAAKDGTFTGKLCPGRYTAMLVKRDLTGETSGRHVVDVQPFEVGAEPVSGIELQAEN